MSAVAIMYLYDRIDSIEHQVSRVGKNRNDKHL